MKKPMVGVIMGSDSDLPIVKETLGILEEFGVEYEAVVLSAHRSPEATVNYAKSATSRGIKVIIAAAGGAAHLAGVIAAHVTLPVIGIPIKTSTLNGMDSLYSIVQMPPGIPVATVGINAAKNAGILAVQILATHDQGLQEKIEKYKQTLNDSVLKKTKELKKIGYRNYLKIMEKK